MSMPFIRLDREANETLSDQIARQWIEAILAGTVRAGHRLPTVRDLARQLGVSLETAQRAYRTLREGGWVESRPRHGTVVRRMRPARETPELKRSEPDRLALLNRIREVSGMPGLFPLSGISLPPEPAVTKVFRHVAARAVEEALRIEERNPPGLEGLRSRVQAWLATRGIWAPMEGILVTGGSQQALSLVAEGLLGPRDAVAVPDMCYLPAVQALGKTGARIIPVRQSRNPWSPAFSG